MFTIVTRFDSGQEVVVPVPERFWYDRCMRSFWPLIAAVAVLAGTAPSALAKTYGCKSDPQVGYSLRVAMAGCTTAKNVQRKWYYNGSGVRWSGTVHEGSRTFRCRVRIIKNHGYDPAVFGDRVTGRILCTDLANKGRFVRWLYKGGGD